MTLPVAPTQDSLLDEIKRRLGDFVVDGWADRSGDEIYQAVARVFSHLAQRVRFYFLSAYTRRARGAHRHRIAVGVTWTTSIVHGWTLLAGQILFTTEWGARFRLVSNWVRGPITVAAQAIVVEAEWAGFEYFVAPGTVNRFALPTTVDPTASLEWSDETTSNGKAEFFEMIADGRLTVVNTEPDTFGEMGLPEHGATGFLDLLGIERMIARALGEEDEVYRARVRQMPEILVPGAILRAVRAALVAGWAPLFGTEPDIEAVELHEYWNYGYAPGASAIGVHPPARKWSFLVVVPYLPDIEDEDARSALWAALLAVIEQTRAPGIWGALYEQPGPWEFDGTVALVSDGASGSYAQAETSAAAQEVFPGVSVPVATFSFWLDQGTTPDGTIFDLGGAGSLYLSMNVLGIDGVADGLYANLSDASGGFGFTNSGQSNVSSALHHYVIVVHDDTVELFIDGAPIGAGPPIASPTWASADDLVLFASRALGDRVVVSIRSPALFSAALGGDAIIGLFNAGPDHDLRAAWEDSSDFEDDLAHWWPAKGDTGETVIDRGHVGGCNLTMHGGVTHD